ncbi:MAG: rhomboid family intramembrane serine protease [Propionibacteriaceae bacterium]|nr:rhomboid family intramembrane serine protease [Propionibacteriaceae bacterium]
MTQENVNAQYSGQQLFCYRHLDRPTYIRCQHCGKPICTECMISAAVGFQCPDCVKQAAKQTRKAKKVSLGRLGSSPILASVTIIAINVLIWLGILLSEVLGGRLSAYLSLSLHGSCQLADQPGYYLPGVTSGAICAAQGGGTVWVPGFGEGAFWQPLTSMFTHEAPLHLLFNMVALWFLGPMLERIVGRGRFLALYLISGLAGSVAVIWLSGADTSTLGASGAIFGLMGGTLVIAHKVGAPVRQILFWIGLNVVFTFASQGISWQGHIGGLIGGLVVAAILAYGPSSPKDRTRILLLGGLTVLLLVGLVVRVFV